jgi:predicted nucleic acid-binding protein
MPRTFVDTVAWIALINSRDSLHDKATHILEKLRREKTELVTSEFVLLEFANALSSPEFRGRASAFVLGLQASPDVTIFECSSKLFSRGFELYSSRPDKEWSLVDCISFEIMTEQGIADGFTEDRHFEQAGFTRLL